MNRLPLAKQIRHILNTFICPYKTVSNTVKIYIVCSRKEFQGLLIPLNIVPPYKQNTILFVYQYIYNVYFIYS